MTSQSRDEHSTRSVGGSAVPPAEQEEEWSSLKLPLSYANQAGLPYVSEYGLKLKLKGSVGEKKIPCDSRPNICLDQLGVLAGSTVVRGASGGKNKNLIRYLVAGFVTYKASKKEGSQEFGENWFLLLVKKSDPNETFLMKPGSTLSVLKQPESELTLPPGCERGSLPNHIIAKRNPKFWYQGVSEYAPYCHVGHGGTWASKTVLGAMCDEPSTCFFATFCPCAALYYQRKSLLLDDLEGNYRCYAGIGNRIGWCCLPDHCVAKHTQGCLVAETLFCTPCALEGNRTMVKQHYGVPHDGCENCIIRPCVDPIAGCVDKTLEWILCCLGQDDAIEDDDCSLCQELTYNLTTWSYYMLCFGCLFAQMNHQTLMSPLGERRRSGSGGVDEIGNSNNEPTTYDGGRSTSRAYPLQTPLNKYGCKSPTEQEVREMEQEFWRKVTDPKRILRSTLGMT